VQRDCERTEECIDGYCQVKVSGGISADNPFLGPIEGVFDAGLSVVANEEMLMEMNKEKLAENKDLDKKVKKGQVSEDKAMKHKAKNIESVAKGTEKAAEMLSQKLVNDPGNKGLQKAYSRVSSHNSIVSEEGQKIKEKRPDLAGNIQQAEKRVNNVREKARDMEVLPVGLRENFGEGTKERQMEKGNLMESGKFGKREGEVAEKPRNIEKIERQVEKGGNSKVAREFKQREGEGESIGSFMAEKTVEIGQKKRERGGAKEGVSAVKLGESVTRPAFNREGVQKDLSKVALGEGKQRGVGDRTLGEGKQRGVGDRTLGEGKQKGFGNKDRTSTEGVKKASRDQSGQVQGESSEQGGKQKKDRKKGDKKKKDKQKNEGERQQQQPRQQQQQQPQQQQQAQPQQQPPIPTGQVVAENVKESGSSFFKFLFFNDNYKK